MSSQSTSTRPLTFKARPPAYRKLKYKNQLAGADDDPKITIKPKSKRKLKPSQITDETLKEEKQPKSIEEPQQPDDDEPSAEAKKIVLKKNISRKTAKGPIQFDSEGLPYATKDNLDRMTLQEVADYCQRWTLEKHLNPLMMELIDFIQVAQKANKAEKCQALLKYKKEFPSGAVGLKEVSYDNTYDSFNWRPETTVTFRGKSWVLPHSSDFKTEIMSRYSEYALTDKDINLNKVNPESKTSPFKYQEIISRLLDPKTPYRGLLAYHGLGSGKTYSSILASTRFLKDGKKVLILLPGALRGNFIEQLYEWGSEEHGIRIPNYKNLKGDEKVAKEKAANKIIAHYYDILTYNERGVYDKLKALTNPETGYLENRLIIVDEIHNLVSRMSKATNLSRQVYYFLMDRTYNCKMLFLSGTPLLNDAYELSILFNILRGKFRTPAGTFTLFPESEELFNDKFVDVYDKSVFNKQLFMRRISGLVSYYAGSTDKKGMPSTEEFPVSKLKMSNHQYQLYVKERFNESRKEQSKSKRQRGNVGESTGSAFRTYSRMVCNFAFPPGIVRPKPVGRHETGLYKQYQNISLDPSKLDLDEVQDELGSDGKVEDIQRKDEQPNDDEEGLGQPILTKKQREETYAKLLLAAIVALETRKDEVFADKFLQIYSPKMFAIKENIMKGPGSEGLAYIYTEFRMLEGVSIMAAVLRYNGFEKIDYTGINSFSDFKKRYPAGQLRYGIISSDEDSKQRKLLKEIFNHPDNAHGEYVKVILGTSASSEGISLMRVRQIHIMEPYWNLVRNNQVKGRGVRYGSHLDLPPEEQNVYIFSYQMELTSTQSAEITEILDNPRESVTSDEHIHRLALAKDQINRQFLKMIKEGAIDCALNYLINVKLDPTLRCLDIPVDIGKYLYLPDINADPTDNEFLKNIKYEDYIVAALKIGDTTYGYKAHPNGRPMIDPPYITYNGKIYHQILTLYDYDLLMNGIEVRRKYYVIGTDIMIDISS